MVNQLDTPPTTLEVINTINDIIDDKQDTLVSGTNIKTINNEPILGAGNIEIQAGSSVDIDNVTITKNVTDALQAIGIVDQNNTAPLYCWGLVGFNTDGSQTAYEVYIKEFPEDDRNNAYLFHKGNVYNADGSVYYSYNKECACWQNSNGMKHIYIRPAIKVIVTQNTYADGTETAYIYSIPSKDTTYTTDPTAVKVWTGTKAEFDVIDAKDATTLYIVTDDTTAEAVADALSDTGNTGNTGGIGDHVGGAGN